MFEIFAEEIHRHPDQQSIAHSALKADGETRDQQPAIFQRHAIALPGGLRFGGNGRLRPVVIRQFGKSHDAGTISSDKPHHEAAEQHQEDRQTKNPAPVQVQHIKHKQ